MWKFEQKTGKIFDDEGTWVGTGYAGRDAGKNNPLLENLKGIGPLPRGVYTGDALVMHDPKLGPYVIHLTPDAPTTERIEAYGRDPESFFMHGDNVKSPGTASHGCIIQSRTTREAFWGSSRVVQVV